jgi:hypothetical protein
VQELSVSSAKIHCWVLGEDAIGMPLADYGKKAV